MLCAFKTVTRASRTLTNGHLLSLQTKMQAVDYHWEKGEMIL